MAGIPPLAGFFGKYLLFLAAFQEEYYLLVGVGMITSLISAFYYLRIIKIMFFESIFDKGNSFNSLWLTLRLSSIERQIYFIIQILIIFFVFGTQ
jgi:NADH-quinone oxidoreductase subunit N